MPLFDYTGQLQSGREFTGTLEADSQHHAEATLNDMGVRVLALRPTLHPAFVAPLSLEEMTFFNEQLMAMSAAGIPLERGLSELAADVGSRKLKRLLSDLAVDLRAGTPLPQALEKQKHRFPPQYGDVIKAGLATGDLGGALYGIARHLRLKSTLRRTLAELMIYPLCILAITFAVTAFLMRVVVPEIELIVHDIYADAALPIGVSWDPTATWDPVPLPSAFLFALAHAWPMVELGLAALLALLLLLVIVVALPGAAGFRERLIRMIPGVAQVYWSSVLARFCHTSALGALSGTPLPELVAASGAASGSRALARDADSVARGLNEGQGVEAAARQTLHIPAVWTCVVANGVLRGNLPAALAELARMYERRAERWVTTVRLIVGPLLLVLIAVIMGFIFVGIVSAMTSVIRSLTQ
jgi:type II secretory pathway component PulF